MVHRHPGNSAGFEGKMLLKLSVPQGVTGWDDGGQEAWAGRGIQHGHYYT